MTSITKPKIAHPSLPRNELGLTRRDYEGGMSTLCAGCGHDSITAAITEAVWGLSLRPENLVKLSGIGCSSKTTAYFVSGSHGKFLLFDSHAEVHSSQRCKRYPMIRIKPARIAWP